jgi:hypothetical protein
MRVWFERIGLNWGKPDEKLKKRQIEDRGDIYQLLAYKPLSAVLLNMRTRQ